MAAVFEINKGINKPLVFKGLKAQYILYLAVGATGLLLFFAILYLCGVNTYLCIGIVIPPGIIVYTTIQRFSKKYGEHGLMKLAARKKLPTHIRISSRSFFQHFN